MWFLRIWKLKENADWKRTLFSMRKKQYLCFIEWHNNILEQLKSEKYVADDLGKRLRRAAKLNNCIQEPTANMLHLCIELRRTLEVTVFDRLGFGRHFSKIVGMSVNTTRSPWKWSLPMDNTMLCKLSKSGAFLLLCFGAKWSFAWIYIAFLCTSQTIDLKIWQHTCYRGCTAAGQSIHLK